MQRLNLGGSGDSDGASSEGLFVIVPIILLLCLLALLRSA